MKLFRILDLVNQISLFGLTESAREQWVIKNMGPKVEQTSGTADAESIVRELRAMDPTKNAQYLQWIARQFVNNQIELSDAIEVTQALQGFHQYKARLRE